MVLNEVISKRERIIIHNNLFKGYLPIIKKERPGIIPEKINPESDTSPWISGRKR